jgi:sulfoxide reductase heme-binding subunit YedZ
VELLLSMALQRNPQALYIQLIVRFAAFVLLVPLAVTSTGTAQRRLGRRWQQLHYAIYPATLLGCWHFYWQVKRDVREPLAYAAVFTFLMAVRALRTVRRRRHAADGAAFADRRGT